MTYLDSINPIRLARHTGWALIASIVLGILVSMFVVKGIDINLNADVEGTANNMLEAESRLRAKAYFSILAFGLQTFITLGMFLLLTTHGRLLSAWSALFGIASSIVILLGSVAVMNAAEIASDAAYRSLADESPATFAHWPSGKYRLHVIPPCAGNVVCFQTLAFSIFF